MKKIIAFVAVALSVMTMSAQKIKVVSGDITVLKGQSELDVVFDYSGMGVGKFKSEEEYVIKKIKDYNKKEAGRGDKWAKAWVEDRNSRFEPKFLTLFNEHILEKINAAEDNASKAKYQMIVKTIWVEPGYNIGISRRPAIANFDIKVIDIATKKQVLFMTVKGVPGETFGGYDFDTGARIGECYALCGKSLAKYIRKKGLK